jgi:hypothetical protein
MGTKQGGTNVIFQNDNESRIYDVEMEQLQGADPIECEMQAERAVFLDRDMRAGKFRQQAGGGGPDNRGRRNYKRFGKRAANASALAQAFADECSRRFGYVSITWTPGERTDDAHRAKRFTAVGLFSILGRNLASRALGISDCSIDTWTKKVKRFPVEADDGRKFAATLTVEWEEYEIERAEKGKAS